MAYQMLLDDLLAHLQVANAMHTLLPAIEKAGSVCVDALKDKRKILLVGNGGSAADAQHVAAELVGRFVNERAGLPAIALTTDTSILTSVANDYGFEFMFSRQVQALGNEGDVLIAYSTSGNSANVIKAVEAAKQQGIAVICMLGKDGGLLAGLCDIPLIIPSSTTSHIQEMHIMVGHMICHMVDEAFLSR